jgi:hypothetical protein
MAGDLADARRRIRQLEREVAELRQQLRTPGDDPMFAAPGVRVGRSRDVSPV